MNKYPTVTVIVNSHNAEKVRPLLDRALASLWDQDFNRPWEVIVVNDGKPTEDIEEACTYWGDRFVDEKGVDFRLMGTEEASGYQCYPKNVATLHARGEYISYLDYDNEWTPQHLQVLFDALHEGNVWPDFTYGRRTYVIDEGCEKKLIPAGSTKEITLPEGDSPFVPWDETALNRLAASPLANFIDTSDFMTSKGALWRLEVATMCMWNTQYRRFADWELLTRAAFFAGWRGKAVDEVVNIYHWHNENVSLTRAANEVPDKKKIQELVDGSV